MRAIYLLYCMLEKWIGNILNIFKTNNTEKQNINEKTKLLTSDNYYENDDEIGNYV